MWDCPKCGVKVDARFEVCWSCGTSREGEEDPTFVRAEEVPPAESPLDLDMPAGEEPVPIPEQKAASELVPCYSALDLMHAKFLADRLSEQGIPAVSDTHDMHDALGSMNAAPRVWVHAADLPRARVWLEAYDKQYKSEHVIE
jgi:putative signal transducing protein